MVHERRHSKRSTIASVCTGLLMLGCGGSGDAPVVVFESNAKRISETAARDPQPIVRASGALAVLVVEPDGQRGENLALLRSESGGDVYRKTLRVNQTPGEVMSHGEGSPRLLGGLADKFYAVWLERKASGNALRIARSDDFLQSFAPAATLDTGAGRGPSFFAAELAGDGTPIVAWIGRGEGETRPGTMQLLMSSSADRGASFTPPVVVASNVCPCCRPAIASSPDGSWVLAWRDTAPNQDRAIVVASSYDRGASWSEPRAVPGRPWQIAGCPHSGPALAVTTGELFVAWYTEADGVGRLLGAASSDGGLSFSPEIDLSGEVVDPNHPALAVLGGKLFVAFQGRAPDADVFTATGIHVREVGVASASVAAPLGEGSATYPTLSALGPDKLLVTWTDVREAGSAALAARARLDARR